MRSIVIFNIIILERQLCNFKPEGRQVLLYSFNSVASQLSDHQITGASATPKLL